MPLFPRRSQALLGEIINQILSGAGETIVFGLWSGSYNSHPRSLKVDSAGATVEGGHLHAEFHFTVAPGWSPAGAHVLAGDLTLPGGPALVSFDGVPIVGARMIVLPHVHGMRPRAEILFLWPSLDDPMNHYRFDADVSLEKGAA